MSKAKKLVSIMLALVLVLSLSITVLAASSSGSTNNGSITINGVTNGETYNFYQIFELTYSDLDAESVSYSYKVTEAWAGFFGEEGAGKTYITLDSNGYISSSSGLTDDNAAAFAKAALAYAEENSIAATKTDTVGTGVTTITESGLSLGYYLIDTTQGTICMLDSTDPSVTVAEKNSTPTISKYVQNVTDKDNNQDGEDDADVADTMQYELVVGGINSVSNVCVHDQEGTNKEDITVDTDSIVIYLKTADSTTVTSSDTVVSTNYTVSTTPTDGCLFEVTFEQSYLDTLSENDELIILYKASYDVSGDDFTGDEETFENTAWVSYGTSATSAIAKADVYTYGFEIYKYTTDDSTGEVPTNAYLAGATFTIQNNSNQYAKFTKASDGKYIFSGWSDTVDSSSYVTSTSTGNIYIEGLDSGTYTVTETSAPDGYNALTGTISVTITPGTTAPSTFTISYTYGSTTTSNVSDHVVNVLNLQGSELPGTGGMGTTIFYIIGAVLVIGAAVILITRRRMNRAE